MNTKSTSASYPVLIPVLLTFFVMSFCDLAGIGVDHAKADFNLSNRMAQMIPLAVFVWFFLLSVPVGILQDRIGKRNMVNIGMIATAAGLILPVLIYSWPVLLAGFVLIGVGNTIMQVSANPLLMDVVTPKFRSSAMNFAQFIKALGSMLPPYVAAMFVHQFGDWRLTFLAFGVISLISVLWLSITPVKEQLGSEERASMGSVLRLLRIPYVVMMVLGIFFVVGIDVGINATSGQFLMDTLEMDSDLAKKGRSLYFLGKMVGTFVAAVLLTRLRPGGYLLVTSLATLVTITVFMFAKSPIMAQLMLSLIGLSAAAIFPLIFTITVSRYEKNANELSGLMIMAVSGGAFIPPLVGWIADATSMHTAMFTFVGCAIYLLIIALPSLKKHTSIPSPDPR